MLLCFGSLLFFLQTGGGCLCGGVWVEVGFGIGGRLSTSTGSVQRVRRGVGGQRTLSPRPNTVGQARSRMGTNDGAQVEVRFDRVSTGSTTCSAQGFGEGEERMNDEL